MAAANSDAITSSSVSQCWVEMRQMISTCAALWCELYFLGRIVHQQELVIKCYKTINMVPHVITFHTITSSHSWLQGLMTTNIYMRLKQQSHYRRVCVFSSVLRWVLMCFKDVRGFSMTNFTIGFGLFEGFVAYQDKKKYPLSVEYVQNNNLFIFTTRPERSSRQCSVWVTSAAWTWLW